MRHLLAALAAIVVLTALARPGLAQTPQEVLEQSLAQREAELRMVQARVKMMEATMAELRTEVADARYQLIRLKNACRSAGVDPDKLLAAYAAAEGEHRPPTTQPASGGPTTRPDTAPAKALPPFASIAALIASMPQSYFQQPGNSPAEKSRKWNERTNWVKANVIGRRISDRGVVWEKRAGREAKGLIVRLRSVGKQGGNRLTSVITVSYPPGRASAVENSQAGEIVPFSGKIAAFNVDWQTVTKSPPARNYTITISIEVDSAKPPAGRDD